jgi:hypothetical protein
MEQELERWLPIQDWPDYEVSNLGRIKSHHNRSYKNHILRPVFTTRNGYMKVTLCYNRIRRDVLVHRIVATAFLRPPKAGEEANHKNLDKVDNRAINLEWVTRAENA